MQIPAGVTPLRSVPVPPPLTADPELNSARSYAQSPQKINVPMGSPPTSPPPFFSPRRRPAIATYPMSPTQYPNPGWPQVYKQNYSAFPDFADNYVPNITIPGYGLGSMGAPGSSFYPLSPVQKQFTTVPGYGIGAETFMSPTKPQTAADFLDEINFLRKQLAAERAHRQALEQQLQLQYWN